MCIRDREKIDLLNLEWLSRAKEYYRLSDHAIEDFLIPVYYKLRKDQIRALAQAASREEFLGILRTTRYGNRIFGQPDPSSGQENPRLKRLFRLLLDAVYQTSGRKNPYSAAVLNTYFYFKMCIRDRSSMTKKVEASSSSSFWRALASVSVVQPHKI